MLNYKRSVFLMGALIILIPLAFVSLIVPRFSKLNTNTERFDCDSHIIILGTAENLSFLNQVYAGAKKVSDQYSTVVELYVPSSQAENSSLQSLFDYASWVDADGIIAYIDSNSGIIDPPLKSDGTEIPVVTIGHYIPEFPQISFIGNNYSEVGQTIANQTVDLLGLEGFVFILNSENRNNPNYSTLMNSLLGAIKRMTNYHYQILDQTYQKNEKILSKALLNDSHISLISLTEEDTIRSAQTLTAMGFAGKTRFISFGSNETISMYLEKGIITKLISENPEKIGSRAIQEIFEYRNTGYANSIISAELLVQTKGE